MSSTAPFIDPGATTAPFSVATRKRGSYSIRPYDTLGVSWLHGALDFAVFRRQTLKRSWQSPFPVRTIEEFEAALDQAMIALRFGGSEVFLILEHDAFVHQTEAAPAFSESASRGYLRSRIARYEQEHGPVIWVSQKTVSVRKDAAFLLHILPASLYDQINSLLRSRRLDLTRILPLAVPLQLAAQALSEDREQPILIATASGDATTAMVARPNGDLFFSRTMLARGDADPARVGVEVNRSLLYAKQQFSISVDNIWLLGPVGETAHKEVESRCGTGKQIHLSPSGPVEWLQSVARLTPRHPINLVAGYLRKKRRQQMLRRVVIAACWLGFCLLGLDTWTQLQNWKTEKSRLEGLKENRPTLVASRDRLRERNAEAEQYRELIHETNDNRTPPVAARLLPYLANTLPAEAHLSDLMVALDPSTNKWSVHLEGEVEGDEETARDLVDTFQRQTAHGPLHLKFLDNARTFAPIAAPGTDAVSSERFGLEGTLFED